uniref:Proteasome activator complex subunit 1 n=1 Tax=Esox lucius TaxID=8010 RepID=A0AAY5L6B5_ESOLU
MTSIDIRPETKKQVDDFCTQLTKEAETLVTSFFPQKIAEMEILLKTSLSVDELASLRAPLDIPMPDPAKEEAKRKKKEEKEAKEGKKDKDSDKEEDAGPPCGPIPCNERVESLLKEIKPQIQILKEKLNTVSMWVQLKIPKIEDGNNFGVAVQEKVFELLTNTRTKIEGFQTQISKYYSERGDAVAKASKQPHVVSALVCVCVCVCVRVCVRACVSVVCVRMHVFQLCYTVCIYPFRETTGSWCMSWTSTSSASCALWFWRSATLTPCCLTSLTRTMTRSRSPEGTARPLSTNYLTVLQIH